MRIRTIKPEFWSHPVFAAQVDEVRLAALGLLNVADDHGYFLASPALIRSALWPLDEDSTKARRVLARLSELGYIEVREHPTHGPIGCVVNFSKHQRVDRPSESKIASYFNSTNVRRGLDDRSSLDQGSGIRDQGSGNEGGVRDEHDIAAPSSHPGGPTSDRDHWRMQVSLEPWARDLRSAGCKIGPENWRQWSPLVTAYGLPGVLGAAKGIPAPERWPDRTESVLAAARGQASASDAVAHKIKRITL